MRRTMTPEQPEVATPPKHDARDLIGAGVQARIELDDKTYWLRITRAGKLILTK
ncbi:hemin uptake protein HemP [Oceaniglobus indicus]|uniref:hemin uptake protein HemP n=1 Tax=Oceaniglobus indicus TaxID=2047749 RepID=UPI000C198D4A|nr:hemin uptake protein HemP [Oceaniglobus indicus]